MWSRVNPILLSVSESGGTADAQGSGPCERKLVGVQVPPLAPIFIFCPAPRALVGRGHRVARGLVAGLLGAVAFRYILDAAADRRRDLGIGAARSGLQLYDVAIDVVTRNRPSSTDPTPHS